MHPGWVALWLEHHPYPKVADLVAGSISGHGIYPGCGFDPWSGCVREVATLSLSLSLSLSPSLSLFFLLVSLSKIHISLGEDKKRRKKKKKEDIHLAVRQNDIRRS